MPSKFLLLSTRPQGLDDSLSDELGAVGKKILIVHVPLVKASSIESNVEKLAGEMADANAVFFVSPSAFEIAYRRLGPNLFYEISEGQKSPHGEPVVMVTVGAKTKKKIVRSLRESGLEEFSDLLNCNPYRLLSPQRGNDTEALAMEPYWKELAGMKGSLLIVKGVGGRKKFAATMREMGIDVRELPIYERVPLFFEAESVLALAQHAKMGHPTHNAAVLTTSTQIAKLWADGLAGEAWDYIRQVPHITIHERIADTLNDLGVANVIVAKGMEADGSDSVATAVASLMEKPDDERQQKHQRQKG